MLLTSHGGALNTGRNSRLYFDTIKAHKVDVIEVDVRKRGDRLYIAHMKSLFPGKAIQLSYVFEYIKEHNFKVNCDLKERGIIGDVIKLAGEIGVKDKLIFTGAVRPSDTDKITAGEVYVNASYYFPVLPKVRNLEKIKEIVFSGGSPHIKGLNLPYQLTSDSFINKAKELDIPLSIYTVDNLAELERIIKADVRNVTTNKVTDAFEIMKKLSS